MLWEMTNSQVPIVVKLLWLAILLARKHEIPGKITVWRGHKLRG